MTHLNPAVLLVWTVLSALVRHRPWHAHLHLLINCILGPLQLGVFLISHLWAFDRFKCLRWNQGSQGAFKRVMTVRHSPFLP